MKKKDYVHTGLGQFTFGQNEQPSAQTNFKQMCSMAMTSVGGAMVGNHI